VTAGVDGRGDWIRTSDLLNPVQSRARSGARSDRIRASPAFRYMARFWRLGGTRSGTAGSRRLPRLPLGPERFVAGSPAGWRSEWWLTGALSQGCARAS